MQSFKFKIFLCLLLTVAPACATIFGVLRGIVHDPSHRPIAQAGFIAANGTESKKRAGLMRENPSPSG